MKFLGVVAVAGLIEKAYPAISRISISKTAETLGLVSVMIAGWAVILGFNQYLPYRVPFQIFGLKEKDDMIAICEKIREVTPLDAVFIQPVENTELKFYAQPLRALWSLKPMLSTKTLCRSNHPANPFNLRRFDGRRQEGICVAGGS